MTHQPAISGHVGRNLAPIMLEVATVLEGINALYGYPFPDRASWSPFELRTEAAAAATWESD